MRILQRKLELNGVPTHPEYFNQLENWYEYRLVYAGGREFRDQYLTKFSDRESDTEFDRRRNISVLPCFAASVLDEIKNSIFERISDVQRIGGPKTYSDAIMGINNGLGVDRMGNTMNSFIGRKIITELLSMGKVGIYVDRDTIPENATLADRNTYAPYVYYYQAEDIISWSRNQQTGRLNSLLLRETHETIDEATGLVSGSEYRYRLCRRVQGGITVTYWTADRSVISEQFLSIPEIPFITASLTHSLLRNVSSYQIALLNVESSDLAYILKSNIPFYTEQYDAAAEMHNVLNSARAAASTPDTDGSAANVGVGKIEVSPSQGRRYPRNVERPAFIHPSTDPLMASMDKSASYRMAIRELVNLNLTALTPSRTSAEAKREDNKTLEAGLSYIGMELQYAENEVARMWAMYENEKPAAIAYPKRYSIRPDSEIRKEAADYVALAKESPSLIYQREILKHIATITVGGKVSNDTLEDIHEQIDGADIVIVDAEIIRQNVEAGLLSRETASLALNYPAGEVAKAAVEHEERAIRILKAQTEIANRGVEDISTNPDNKTGKAADMDDTTEVDNE